MISALVSGLSGPDLRPGWGHCVVFLGRHFALTVSLSNQVLKWVAANLMLGVTLQWTSIPSKSEALEQMAHSCRSLSQFL